MNPIQKFFATYNISAHTISGAILSFTGLYLTVPALKSFVDSLLANNKTAAAAFAAVIGIALTYKPSHSTQGQVAQLITTPSDQLQTAVAAANDASSPASPAITIKKG